MKIPIANLYYLLCYAWNTLEQADTIKIDVEPSAPIADLFACVLARGVEHLLKQGLGREYRLEQEDVSGVRGRIDWSNTVRRQLLANGRTSSQFDELTFDTLPNQTLKGTMRLLVRAEGLDARLRADLSGLCRRMTGVRDADVRGVHLRTIQVRRGTRFYGFLLDVCKIVLDNLLVDERTGQVTFLDFVRDEAQMARLFERFVRNLLAREQSNYTVSSPQIVWQGVQASDDALSYLPVMQTDTVLCSPKRKIIIDTKYYRDAFEGRGKPKVRSEHLYQLSAYLANADVAENQRLDGVLLYPAVGSEFALEYLIRTHWIRVTSVNLARPWQAVREQILNLAC